MTAARDLRTWHGLSCLSDTACARLFAAQLVDLGIEQQSIEHGCGQARIVEVAKAELEW